MKKLTLYTNKKCFVWVIQRCMFALLNFLAIFLLFQTLMQKFMSSWPYGSFVFQLYSKRRLLFVMLLFYEQFVLFFRHEREEKKTLFSVAFETLKGVASMENASVS